MKTTIFAMLMVGAALSVAPVLGGDAEGGKAPAAGEGAHVAAPGEGAPSAEAVALQKEFFALQKEIRAARLEMRKRPEVQAILTQVDALSPETDQDKIRDLLVQARTLTEKFLAEQPGMPEKLLRLKELGDQFRATLPAELRRKGKRLPVRKEGEGAPSAEAAEK